MKCFDKTPEDYPCCITDDFCCVKTNLEAVFQNEVGEAHFQRITSEYCDNNNLGSPRYSMENSFIVKRFIELLREEGHQSAKLNEIVALIIKKYNAS